MSKLGDNSLYSPFILRPPDAVQLPKDYKRPNYIGDTATVSYYDAPISCESTACQAGANVQSWCKPEVATDYYAMRPIITIEKYDQWLQQLFNELRGFATQANIVNGQIDEWKITSLNNAPNVNEPPYDLVNKAFQAYDSKTFVDEQTATMNWLMKAIAEAVTKLPSMHHNGSWKEEEFHHTDVKFYASFITKDTKMIGNYYNIVFNLYNALRSTSTIVSCDIGMYQPTLNKVYKWIDNISLVNDQNTGDIQGIPADINDPSGYNITDNSAKALQIEINPDTGVNCNSLTKTCASDPKPIKWLYGNTLEIPEYNMHGFNTPGSNVKLQGAGSNTDSLEGFVPKDLELPSDQDFQQQQLLPCNYMEVGADTGKPILSLNKLNIYATNDHSQLNNPSSVYFSGPTNMGSTWMT